MGRRLSEALDSSKQTGEGFSGAERARALKSKERVGKRPSGKGPKGRVDRSRPADLRVSVEEAGLSAGSATAEELHDYGSEVASVFSDSNVTSENKLLATADSYNDIKDVDGNVLEAGVIDSSMKLAADGRTVVLSRNEFGDIVLLQMQEAAHRISSDDDKVEDRFVFVPADSADAFLAEVDAVKETKEAGYLEDKNVARMAAERELIPREETAAEKERASVDKDILEFQLKRLEGTQASHLVNTPESDLVDPEVIKSKLVEQARHKLELASNRVQAAVDQGNRAGNAASSEFLAVRAKTSEEIAKMTLELNSLSGETSGHVDVFPQENQEATDVVFASFASMVKPSDSPFLERNTRDADIGVLVKELYYHTNQPNRVMVESWNNATGKLIMATLIQCENPTRLRPMSRYRAELRVLMGKKRRIEELSDQAEAELRSARSISDIYRSNNDSAGGGYALAETVFKQSLQKLHPTNIELPLKIKPRKRIPWLEKFFGNRIAH